MAWAAGMTTAAVLALTIGPVAAHDGETEYIGEINGYYVEVSDDVVPDTGLFYTLYLRDLERGLPVDDAIIEITAQSGANVVGPVVAVRLANAYSLIIPDGGQKEWTIDVRIDHEPRGVTTFTHTIAGVGATDEQTGWASTTVQILIWTLPVVGLFILHRSGQRRRTRPGT